MTANEGKKILETRGVTSGWIQGVTVTDTAMAATMKEAGLDEPIAVLAQMNGQSRFFDCEPYGKCWAPTNG